MRIVASLLLALAVGIAAVAASPGAVLAHGKLTTTEADAREIRRVISRQLDAFRQDDARAAFELAAPSIQLRYATPETFLAVVRRHYAPVYRSKSATFGRLAMWRGSVTQEVAIVGADGRRYTALYPMEKLAGGRWRIAGCMILQDRSI